MSRAYLSDMNRICSGGRYLHDREKTPESAANMKRLLTHLRNLPLKKKLATDLGITDLLSPTLDEGFLNDIARL